MIDPQRHLKSLRRRLTEDEIQLWLQVAKTIERRPGMVLPEAAADPKPPARLPPKPLPVPPRAATAAPYSPPRSQLRQESGPAPLERRLKQQLLRGRATVEEVLDLHGLHQDAAHRSLRQFLAGAQARGARVVLVITGKGRMSLHKDEHERETGVLRRAVPHWLRLPDLAPLIVGFEEAGALHGGAGALYLRLRRG